MRHPGDEGELEVDVGDGRCGRFRFRIRFERILKCESKIIRAPEMVTGFFQE